MARQVAFAIQLPLLSEEQEKGIRRYGSEKCEEIRIVTRDHGVVFAGILISNFKTKRVAQSSFTGYLKSWDISPLTYQRWYREVSLDEYFAEFAGVPRVLGRGLQEVVSSTVMRLICTGMQAVMARDREAAAKAKELSERQARVQWRTERWTYRVLREIFNVFSRTKLELIREQNAMFDAEQESKKAAIFRVEEEARQVIRAHEHRLKTDWQYREKTELELIARQREQSIKAVAIFNTLHPEEAYKKRKLT